VSDADVVVLGGGPAGAAASIVLAEAGHAVTLIRPTHPPGSTLAQSVPPSARSLLGELGLLEAVASSGFVPNTGNTTRWAGTPVRHEVFPVDDGHASGFHVDRGRLEDALLGPLQSAGVRILTGHSARSANRDVDGWWRVGSIGPDGERSVSRARWVIDATGRHGFLARRLGRVPTGGSRTLAVVARWRGHEHDPAVTGHTVVESLPDGWIWSVPVEPGVRCVTAMVDPAHTRVPGGALGSWLTARVQEAPLMAETLQAYAPEGDAWACPASTYETTDYHRDRVVLAGDAGTFIDPLSSYGVKKALASGRVAGIAVATALERPELEELALAYHEGTERRMAAGYRARSAHFFTEGAQAHPHPFWTDRADAGGVAPPTGAAASFDLDGSVSHSEHRCDVDPADALRVYERIRAAPHIAWRPGATVATRDEPALSGRRIVPEPHLTSAIHPRPVRFHGSVDLRRLVALAPSRAEVPDLWDAYGRSGPAVPLPDFLTALAVACTAGFLDFEAT